MKIKIFRVKKITPELFNRDIPKQYRTVKDDNILDIFFYKKIVEINDENIQYRNEKIKI